MVKDTTDKIEYHQIAELIENGVYDRQVIITKDGKDVAALVSLADLELLKEIRIEMKRVEDINRNVTVKMMNMSGETLTYDEMEYIRDQIIKAFDSMFKPDTEKMN